MPVLRSFRCLLSLSVIVAAGPMDGRAEAAAAPVPETSPPPSAPNEAGRLVIGAFMPWQPLTHNVMLSQRYYDMALQRSPNDRIEALRDELKQMAACGIDATTCDLVMREDRLTFAFVFGDMLEAAEGTGVRVFPLLDVVSDEPAAVRHLVDALQRWGDNPNWLHVDGRPAVATFWGGRYAPELFRNLNRQLAEHGIKLFWLGDAAYFWNRPITFDTLAKYDGLFDIIYSFAEHGRGGNQSVHDSYQALKEAAPKVAGAKAWATGISPGYLGGWISGRNDYYLPYRNFDTYLDAWTAALEANPDWLFLTTWNDRDETHIQPSLYQWTSLTDIAAYFAHQWKTGSRPDQPARLYAAYPREQLLGTVERIELLRLPGRDASPVTVQGELRGADGRVLASLAERTLGGDTPVTVDWLVDTLPFAEDPVIYPVLTLTQNGASRECRLPAFVLRSGWIENQAVVKFPLDLASEGRASLTLDPTPDGGLNTRVTYTGSEPLRTAELFRNDHRLASFDPAHPQEARAQLILKGTQRGGTARMSVSDGRILRARRSDANDKAHISWDETSLRTAMGHAQMTAVEIAGTPQTRLTFTGPGHASQELTLREIQQTEGSRLVAGDVVNLLPPRFDGLADDAADLTAATTGESPHTLTARFLPGPSRPEDSYHVRLTTTSGKVIETPWIYPGLTDTTPQPTTVIHSALSMDMRDWDDYHGKPDAPAGRVATVAAHPAILQREAWNFNDEINPGRDTAGRNNLILGRGESYLIADAKRMPQWLPGQGPDGSACLAFDGVDDRAQLPVQQDPKGPFRITFDIHPTGPPEGVQDILAGVGRKNRTTPGIVIRRLADGCLAAGRNTFELATSPQPIPPGQWTSVQVAFTGDRTLLFLNGKQVAATASPADYKRFGNSRMYLGGQEMPLQGWLDNVVIEGYCPPQPAVAASPQ